MRQNAFIETSAINWLYDAGFDACRTNVLLATEKLIPIVGMDTLYELARCFTVDPKRAQSLFYFLKQLRPHCSCQRDRLYIQELDNLRVGKAVGTRLGYYADRKY